MGTRLLEHVREGQAPAEVAGAYRDVRRALRLTWVPLFFRALAPHRGLLRAVWKELRPDVVTHAFEEDADELRARLVRIAADLHTPLLEPVLAANGFDVDALDEIRSQLALFHYADPKVLLCVATLARAVAGERVGPGGTEGDAIVLPEGPPADMPELKLLPEEPGGITGEIFHEILETTHLPVAEVDLRVLGHWPSFLDVAWPEISPVFRHPDTERALATVRALAARESETLPFRCDLSTGRLSDAEPHRATLMRLCALFLDAMPRLALFATALEVALDGPETALQSPFPVEWEEPETLFT